MNGRMKSHKKKRNKIKWRSITCSNIWHIDSLKYVNKLDIQSVIIKLYFLQISNGYRSQSGKTLTIAPQLDKFRLHPLLHSSRRKKINGSST